MTEEPAEVEQRLQHEAAGFTRRRRSRSAAGPPPARTPPLSEPSIDAAASGPDFAGPHGTTLPSTTLSSTTVPSTTLPSSGSTSGSPSATPLDSASVPEQRPPIASGGTTAALAGSGRSGRGTGAVAKRAQRPHRDGGHGGRPEARADGPWRDLTGSGRSQVSQTAALRARDADRPTAGELARAERELVIKRRNWTPDR